MPVAARTLPIWLLLLAVGCRTSAAKGPAPELLATGKKHFEAKEYREAERHFKGIKRYHPESIEAEEALFLLAESQRHQRDADSAFENYKKLLEDYPNSRFAVGAAEGEYALGIDYLDGHIPGVLFFPKPRDRGVDVLEHMQIHFRHHRLADEALLRVADFQLQEGEFISAAEVLRRLLSDYPRSNHAIRARFDLGEALLNQNGGPLYDVRLLYDSRSSYRDFVATAGAAGLGERYAKQIAVAQKRIRFIDHRLAQRKFLQAKFYERTDAPWAAKLYYEAVARDYSDSEFAEQSRQRLAELQKASSEQPEGEERSG